MQFKVIKMISIRNSSKIVSFPYLLSCLDNFINVNALKMSTPLTPQDALSTHRNITRTIRTIPLWSLISRDSYWWLKRRMQAEKGSHAIENRKRLKKRAETQLTRTEKLIGPIWRARWEDQSYGLGSSIRQPERQNL